MQRFIYVTRTMPSRQRNRRFRYTQGTRTFPYSGDVPTEPSGRRRWRVMVERGDGPEPASVVLPATLGSGLRLVADVKGAATKLDGARVLVDPTARSWTAVYGA